MDDAADLAGESGEIVYQARWLSPDGEQLLSPGCLHVRHGCVVRVWEGTDVDAVKLGDVALIPGLINAHTHLEFSDLQRPLAAEAGFPDWIRRVIQSRRERSGDRLEAIRQGWAECQASGTTALGEIATDDATYSELATLGAAGVVFREVLGLQESAVAAGLETARNWLSASPTLQDLAPPLTPASATLTRGLSPHAPYSLHPQLFRGLVDLAAETGAPAAMHLAETREELELLAHHRGGLVDLLQSLGLWRAELFTEFRRPLDYLHELSRCTTALVVHGNYLDDEAIDFLATQPQMSVVYCPRTHAAFGHTPHPWRMMRERGLRVVLGTDSRASNPDLSLVQELRWLHARFPDVPVQELLQMATRDAAAALGKSDQWGELALGRPALFTLLQPRGRLTPSDWSPLL